MFRRLPLCFCVLASSPAWAQELPPVLEDLGPAYKLDRRLEVKDIGLGDTYGEVKAKLAKLMGREASKFYDDFIGPYAFRPGFRDSFSIDRIREDWNIRFSTRVNGERVTYIKRDVTYPDDAPVALADLDSALSANFGEISYKQQGPHTGMDEDPMGLSITYSYLWFGGKRASQAELKAGMRGEWPLDWGRCIESSPPDMRYWDWRSPSWARPKLGDGAVACTASVRVQFFIGPRAGQVNRVIFALTDNARLEKNVADTHKFLESLPRSKPDL